MSKGKSGPLNFGHFTDQKEQRRERVRECIRLSNLGKTRQQIADETGFAFSTVCRYLDEHENDDAVLIKKPPKNRKCLRCRRDFKPRAFSIFMCAVCNDFARGVMI